MLRRADGWHLEIVAFGAGGVHADERVATVPNLKERLQVPRKGAGWTRRELGLALDAKLGHEHLPIDITILAYGPADVAKDDFVPDLASADGVLFFESGEAALDSRIAAAIDAALAERGGTPPRIVERAKEDGAKSGIRSVVKQTVQALKTGQLHAFWQQSDRHMVAAHDEAVFGALTKEKILGQPEGELVAFMLRAVRERGRRAVRSGRLATSDAYDHSLSARWQRLLAVSSLEAVIADDGVAALFAAAGARPMEREEVTAALAGLKRIGAAKKAAIIERAMVVAREANLWEGATDATASQVLEELSTRFYAVDDEPLGLCLERDIRKAPDEYTLSAYEDS
jgi:hypothetical protein